MNLARLVLLACAAIFFAAPPAAVAESISLAERATLQATMQGHIEANLVDGHYLYADARTGKVKGLEPGASHPVILRTGEYFILCADFRGEDGSAVNVDFFLARRDQGFFVFSQQVANRKLVAHLLHNGRASRIQ